VTPNGVSSDLSLLDILVKGNNERSDFNQIGFLEKHLFNWLIHLFLYGCDVIFSLIHHFSKQKTHHGKVPLVKFLKQLSLLFCKISLVCLVLIFY
jgi:hypothetical protein